MRKPEMESGSTPLGMLDLEADEGTASKQVKAIEATMTTPALHDAPDAVDPTGSMLPPTVLGRRWA